MTEAEERFCDILIALEDAQETITELVLEAESGSGAKVSTVQPRAVLSKITRYLEGDDEGEDDAELTTEDFAEAIEFGEALIKDATVAICNLTDALLP